MSDRNISININDVSPSANTAYVDLNIDNKTYNKEQINQKISDSLDGVSQISITPTTTISELAALPSAVYRARGEGAYKFESLPNYGPIVNKIVPEGYDVKFVKNLEGWNVHSVIKLPQYDDTSLQNRMSTLENEWENYAVEVDEVFSENSNNAIANKLVAPLNKMLKGFEKSVYQKTNIITNAVTTGIFGSAGTVLTSGTCKYIVGFPTNGKTHLDYGHSNYSNDTHTFIWGVKADSTKELILARRTAPTESAILSYGEDIDISQYTTLNFAYFPARGSNQYINIYSKNEEDIIGYTADEGAVKEYIDSKSSNNDTELILATSKDMVGRLINSSNGDGINTSYLAFRNILLPKNVVKLRYTGIKTNSAETSSFVPLIGVKYDGTHETILPLTISSTNYEETVDLEIPKDKYYAISYCSRLTPNAKITAIVDNVDFSEQIRKEYLLSNNNDSVQKIPRLASAEAGWYSTFTQNTCVTCGEFTFGFFVEGAGAGVVVFSINNRTGETKFNNLLINNGFTKSEIDGHNAYSITITKAGYIIISGNCHSQTPQTAISDNPLDISKFTNWNYTGATDISYPRFVRSKEGDLYAFYRRGSSGSGNTYFASFNDETKQFNTPILLIDATSESAGNPYLQTPIVDRNGVIKVAFGFRRSSGDWGTMTGLYYIESADKGVTWRKSTGESYNLPIKKSTAERVVTIAEQSGYVNQNGACVDVNNNLITAMTQRKTIEGVTTDWIVIIKQTSSGWITEDIYNTGTLSPFGSIYVGNYGRPSVFVNRLNEPVIVFNSTTEDRSLIAINTATKQRKIIATGIHHSAVFDNEYARDYFIFKTLLVNGQNQVNLPQTANRYFELFIYESKLL